jgi:maleate cis-trans isomerase
MAPTTVGILYPGYAAEDDYPWLERTLEVRLPLVHTSVGEDAHRVDALLDLGGPDRLAEGAAALPSSIDAVMWACTSGSFVFGTKGAREQVDRLSAAAGGIPASSTSFAFAGAVRALGLHRVAVAATYPSDVTDRFVAFLAASGIEVVSHEARGIVTAAEVGRLGRDDVLTFAAAHDHPTAEAVLVPDTALHSARWLDELDQRLGKPVLTANQVTVWEGLRLAGDGADRAGAGTLFRLGGVMA